MSYEPPRVDGIDTMASTIVSHDVLGAWAPYGNAASNGYPLANLAFYVPFSVSAPVTAVEGWVSCGTVSGGNFDIGIYDAAGSQLTSAGSTARTASAIVNTTTMTDQALVPGVRYYMAFSASSTNNYVAGVLAAGLYEAAGILESTSSFALPASPTLSRTTRAYLPLFGLTLTSVGF